MQPVRSTARTVVKSLPSWGPAHHEADSKNGPLNKSISWKLISLNKKSLNLFCCTVTTIVCISYTAQCRFQPQVLICITWLNLFCIC